MEVVYSSSDAYCECTCISLISLFENNKHIESLNVYILSTDISNDNKECILDIGKKYKRDIYIIEAKDGFIEGAKFFKLELSRGSYNTYSRIMLNKWFAMLEKIIVIDSDTLVVGDISEIWDIDVSNHLLTAVPEIGVYSKYSTIESRELLESVETYFNMGIIMVNLKKWRDLSIDDYLLKKTNEDKKPNLVADQSILNRYLNDYILRMHLKFNYYSPMHKTSYKRVLKVFDKKIIFQQEEFLEAQKAPTIIHFYGHSYERPWFKHSASPYKKEYLKYRKLSKWNDAKKQKWKKSPNLIFKVYDILCFMLLKIHLYDACLSFRYITGQKIKSRTKMKR